MAEFNGKGLVIQWADNSGTVVVSGLQTAFNVDDKAKLIETTAGADISTEYIAGNIDCSASMTVLHNGTAGTALYNRLAMNANGTLIWSPLGTATTQPKYSKLAFVSGRKHDFPPDDKVTIAFDFQLSGPYIWNGDAGDKW